MLMIEVLVSSGTHTNWKKGLVAALVEKLGEAGIDPNDMMVFFFGDGSREWIIRWRPVRTTSCLRLITADRILAAWLRRSRRGTGELRSPQQWICEPLLKNQQPRWALMEMKELDSGENERPKPIRRERQPLDESLTSRRF
jgi:hypothetical protein